MANLLSPSKIRWLILLSAVSLCAAGCSEVVSVAANLPSYLSNQKITADLDFGSPYGSKLDVYRPADHRGGHPVIVFFYGGSWKSGDKSTYRFVADAFTGCGYVVVIPNYVKYPRAKFPAWQDDAARAIVWTHANIARYGGDARELFVMGHSAGGQIGAIAVTDNEYLKRNSGDRAWVRAFAGLAGPYDFTPDEPDYIAMFGPPNRYPRMQVPTFIDGRQPPMLLLWGTSDKVVGEINITKLVAVLKSNGGEYRVKFYHGLGHVDMVGALTRIERGKAPILDDVDAWFRRHLEKPHNP